MWLPALATDDFFFPGSDNIPGLLLAHGTHQLLKSSCSCNEENHNGKSCSEHPLVVMAAPEGTCAESGLLQLASSRSSLSRCECARGEQRTGCVVTLIILSHMYRCTPESQFMASHADALRMTTTPFLTYSTQWHLNTYPRTVVPYHVLLSWQLPF